MSKQSNLQLNLSAYWVLLWASSSPSRSVQACRMVHAVAWLKNKWDRPPCLFHHHGKDMYLRYCCRVSCNLCFSSQLLRHVFFFHVYQPAAQWALVQTAHLHVLVFCTWLMTSRSGGPAHAWRIFVGLEIVSMKRFDWHVPWCVALASAVAWQVVSYHSSSTGTLSQ